MRGLVVGIIIATLTVLAQKALYVHWTYLRLISPVDYDWLNPIIWGGLLALGALGGDALKSFFKRQLDIAPGESWLVFDQLDYVFGVILLTYWYIPLSLEQYIYLTITWFILHILTTIAGYLLGLKQKVI